LLHFFFREGPVSFVSLFFEKDDTCLLEKPNKLKDALLEASELVLDIYFDRSDIVWVIENYVLLVIFL
jgi:hypothetical protein